jgi:hypothetical protein
MFADPAPDPRIAPAHQVVRHHLRRNLIGETDRAHVVMRPRSPVIASVRPCPIERLRYLAIASFDQPSRFSAHGLQTKSPLSSLIAGSSSLQAHSMPISGVATARQKFLTLPNGT